MRKTISQCAAISFVVLSLSGCQAMEKNSQVGAGKVVVLGQEKLILENEGEFLFLDVEQTDRERLAQLKKGEHVTLWGKTETAQNAVSSITSESSEIYEVVEDNGTHIRLGNRLSQ